MGCLAESPITCQRYQPLRYRIRIFITIIRGKYGSYSKLTTSLPSNKLTFSWYWYSSAGLVSCPVIGSWCNVTKALPRKPRELFLTSWELTQHNIFNVPYGLEVEGYLSKSARLNQLTGIGPKNRLANT